MNNQNWQVAIAYNIAEKAHDGQFDKAGEPYINHPLSVAKMVKSDEAKVVALLHDVLEDTDIAIDDLRGYGFDKEIIDALQLLNHDPYVPYMNYILTLSHNDLATEVKIADLRHNMNLTRLKRITKKDVLRQQKYLGALALLMEVDLNEN